MSLHRTSCGCCETEIGMTRAHTPHYCDHGQLFLYTKELGRSIPPSKTQSPAPPKKRKGMKAGKGFAASKEQRAKIENLPCAGCSMMDFDGEVYGPRPDPAHVWPRGMGGCDHEDCVVPLCRECHNKLDDPSVRFDLLSKLVDRGYWPELAHPVAAHSVSPLTLLERLTGETWMPAESRVAA